MYIYNFVFGLTGVRKHTSATSRSIGSQYADWAINGLTLTLYSVVQNSSQIPTCLCSWYSYNKKVRWVLCMGDGVGGGGGGGRDGLGWGTIYCNVMRM